jgi:hypothetical protein
MINVPNPESSPIRHPNSHHPTRRPMSVMMMANTPSAPHLSTLNAPAITVNDPDLLNRPRKGDSNAPRITVLVAKQPFLDVLRISGQKKTLVIDQNNPQEKILRQMYAVVCRPLQKGAVANFVMRECETYSLAFEIIEKDNSLSLKFVGMLIVCVWGWG